MAEREGLGRQGRDRETGSRRHTRGRREWRQERDEKRKGEGAGADTGHGHTRREGHGGQQRKTGTTHHPQIDAMRMTRIEPYRTPRPTIRELMEGRPAGVEDGGILPKGYLGRPPKLAYRTDDRAQAERHVRAREIQPWPGEKQRGAHGAGEKQ